MVGMTFDTESTMDNFVNQYASENGFSVTNNTNYHKGEKARKLSGGTRDKMLAVGITIVTNVKKVAPSKSNTRMTQKRSNIVSMRSSWIILPMVARMC